MLRERIVTDQRYGAVVVRLWRPRDVSVPAPFLFRSRRFARTLPRGIFAGVSTEPNDRLTLRVLGAVSLAGREGAEALLAQPKRAALLIYLAAARPNGHHRRDRLVSMFWPEHDQDHARAALRKALYAIRQTLGDDVIVARGDEEVAVSDSVWCDSTEFRAFATKERFAAALELYHGDFLDGFFADAPGFERWVEEERGHCRELAGTCAWTLAERYASSADLTSATRWARRAVNLAPSDERRLRKALTLLLQAGDRAGAVRLFEDFARRLRADLDVDPSVETLNLVKQIRER